MITDVLDVVSKVLEIADAVVNFNVMLGLDKRTTIKERKKLVTQITADWKAIAFWSTEVLLIAPNHQSQLSQ